MVCVDCVWFFSEAMPTLSAVDDHSTLAELQYLPAHLAQLPAGLIKHVRRGKHDGIVGARVRGALESSHPVIVYIDSHAEVRDLALAHLAIANTLAWPYLPNPLLW